MTAIWKFRLLALLIVVLVGGISSANLAAELLRPDPLPVPSRSSSSPTSEQVSSATVAASIAPFRSDLAANQALAFAGKALKSEIKGQSETLNAAQRAVRSALKIEPHDSRMWLVLALVQARTNPVDPLIAKSLKNSYLTGPNQAELVPLRLDAVTANNALSDSDLGELARSDVRALLTRLPGQRQTLADDYARASEIGKKFLEESIAAVDPGSVDLLRKK
jgi:hypothetical protein